MVFISGEPNTPGHRYRIVNIASVLPPRFFETAVIPIEDLRERRTELSDVDVLWIWRSRHSRALAAAVSAARAVGGRVVFDMDDLIFRPELSRAEVIAGNRGIGLAKRVAVRHHYKSLQRALVQADHCTATTEPLARQMRLLGKSTTVVPNGFDATFLRMARDARARRDSGLESNVVRIGYAAGTFTHQRDLAAAVPALTQVLVEHPEARFVGFRDAIDVGEFPALRALTTQIELRPLVPLDDLPREYARFDVNIAPLEVGNPFCESKSELKYFEAALAGTVTVASPTEPFVAAIRHGETGFLAADQRSWYEALSVLITDRDARQRTSEAAYRDVLWRFGPERRALLVGKLVHELLARPAEGS